MTGPWKPTSLGRTRYNEANRERREGRARRAAKRTRDSSAYAQGLKERFGEPQGEWGRVDRQARVDERDRLFREGHTSPEDAERQATDRMERLRAEVGRDGFIDGSWRGVNDRKRVGNMRQRDSIGAPASLSAVIDVLFPQFSSREPNPVVYASPEVQQRFNRRPKHVGRIPPPVPQVAPRGDYGPPDEFAGTRLLPGETLSGLAMNYYGMETPQGADFYGRGYDNLIRKDRGLRGFPDYKDLPVGYPVPWKEMPSNKERADDYASGRKRPHPPPPKRKKK